MNDDSIAVEILKAALASGTLQKCATGKELGEEIGDAYAEIIKKIRASRAAR